MTSPGYQAIKERYQEDLADTQDARDFEFRPLRNYEDDAELHDAYLHLMPRIPQDQKQRQLRTFGLDRMAAHIRARWGF